MDGAPGPGGSLNPVPDTLADRPDPTTEPAVPSARHGFTPLRILGVSTMLAIALFWFWIFAGGPAKQNPDRLADREWAEQAETTCRRTMDGIDERTRDAGTEDRATRADAIDTSTGELRTMLAALRDPLPGPAADREVVAPWLADWEQLLDDRDAYADAIREDANARFLMTEKYNDPLDRVVEVFADVNDMPSCAPAGDVG